MQTKRGNCEHKNTATSYGEVIVELVRDSETKLHGSFSLLVVEAISDAGRPGGIYADITAANCSKRGQRCERCSRPLRVI